MRTNQPTSALSRRFALGAGAALAGGMVAAGSASARTNANGNQSQGSGTQSNNNGSQMSFPVRQMENIIGARGSIRHGLLHFAVERKDLNNVSGPTGPRLDGRRIPFRPAWTINGGFWFQAIGSNRAIMNADFAFRPDEINPAIDAMIRNGLQLEAFHQHFMGLQPMVFFMHFRGTGDPVNIAQGISAVLGATAAPRPQNPPQNPQTPLNHQRLAQILGGNATVGGDGTVAVLIPRRNQMVLNGWNVSPYLHVAANCRFQPLNQQGSVVAVAPDFSMTTREVMPVMSAMRSQGWAVHCLYNQETGEHPQLFYSHQLKVGNPYQLAQEVRHGLDQTNTVGASPRMANRG